ncbi:MAG: hypothetical protein BWK80_23890 [Desulfobacteraceae bacterium IS3]|nr:MAG: hypothetical protein BWK80_23890 [Desulfobacteraceae bacterium IS3]
MKFNPFGSKWGDFIEDFVAPAAEWLFKEWGIEIHEVYQQARKWREDGKRIEIDIVGVNSEYIVLIKVSTTLGIDDVKEHLERLAQFREFFPQYGNRKIVGAVAGIVIDEGADKFAYKNGLFVIAQSGESVKILNDPNFKPKLL